MRWLAALLALPGCDTVFGLERPTVDAPPPVIVTGRITQRYLHGDTGLALVAEATPLAQAEAPTVRSNGEDIEVGWSASEGLFTFSAPGGAPYQLSYQGSEYQLSAPTVALDWLVPGRANAVAPATGTVLRITPTSPLPAGANVYVMSTGIFSVARPNTVDVSDFQLNWINADFSGTPGLLSAADHDEAYLVMFIHDPGGYEAMESYVPASVTLAQGTTVTASGPVLQVPRDNCLTVENAPIEAELARVRGLFPAFVSGEPSWTMYQSARLDLGVSVSYTLASDHTLVTGGTTDIRYGLVMPSFGALMSRTAMASRVVDGQTIYALSIYFQEVAPQMTCAVQPTPMGIVMPTKPALAGVAITDNVTIGIPKGVDPVLAWEDSPGLIAATSYKTELYAIMNGLLQLRRTIYSAEPRVIIARDLLDNDTSYMAQIFAGNGIPEFRAGEVTRQLLPYAAGIVWTPPFKVSK